VSAHARRTDPHTSHAAAASITEQQLTDGQRAVLQTLRRIGPAIDPQIVASYVGPWQSPSGLRTRRHELVERGLVRDTERRVKLPSGRQAIVWEAVGGRAQVGVEATAASLFDDHAASGPSSAIYGT
jgi:hypothetical protein